MTFFTAIVSATTHLYMRKYSAEIPPSYVCTFWSRRNLYMEQAFVIQYKAVLTSRRHQPIREGHWWLAATSKPPHTIGQLSAPNGMRGCVWWQPMRDRLRWLAFRPPGSRGMFFKLGDVAGRWMKRQVCTDTLAAYFLLHFTLGPFATNLCVNTQVMQQSTTGR